MKKKKIWSTTVADDKFSLWIRQRDKRCLRCGGTEFLTCSHFWGRTKSALRFMPDNCITLCYWKCHIDHNRGWEHAKQGEYRDFMIKRLGKKRYDELEKLYYQSKMTRQEAIKELMSWLLDAPQTSYNAI